jgi:nucleoside-diphosphate-sugar epimerase
VSTPELVRAIADAFEVRRGCGACRRSCSCRPRHCWPRAAVRRLTESLTIDDARIRRTLGWKPTTTMAGELERLAASLNHA